MQTFIKYLFSVIGGILIGMGLGIFVCQNNLLDGNMRQICMILGLIVGGFFLAMGIPSKRTDHPERDLSQQA